MRKNQREFYNRTQENANAPRRDATQPVRKSMQKGAQPEWYYKAPTWIVSVGGYFAVIAFIQFIAMSTYNLQRNVEPVGFFSNIWNLRVIYLFLLLAVPIVYFIALKN